MIQCPYYAIESNFFMEYKSYSTAIFIPHLFRILMQGQHLLFHAPLSSSLIICSAFTVFVRLLIPAIITIIGAYAHSFHYFCYYLLQDINPVKKYELRLLIYFVLYMILPWFIINSFINWIIYKKKIKKNKKKNL